MSILKIIYWVIPAFGSFRSEPYARLCVTDGTHEKEVITHEDEKGQYFTFNRKRFYVKNIGSLYSPSLIINNS